MNTPLRSELLEITLKPFITGLIHLTGLNNETNFGVLFVCNLVIF